MLANQEAYEFEMQLVSKKAIVSAWEKTQKGEMAVDSINRLKAECRDIVRLFESLKDYIFSKIMCK